MKKISQMLLISIIFTLSSCVYTLFPIFTEDTLVYEPQLVGKWKNKNGSVEFTSHGSDGYRVRFLDTDTISFRGRLAKVGNNMFLDFYPDESEYNVMEYLASNYFPVHTFMKIEVKQQEIKITQFNLSELKNLFETNRIRLRHELVDGNVLITAQPKEIQKFLLHYSEDDKVFEKPEVFIKTDS